LGYKKDQHQFELVEFELVNHVDDFDQIALLQKITLINQGYVQGDED
jgi:hypothetical protein